MVDFSVPNLCGASLELNDVLSKLSDAKADATAKLDEAASTAAAAFDVAQNELAGLKDKLQSIEIPTLPKLNLQAEITSLLSQVPGSVGYAVALAKIGLEFKSDIESKGLTLETLVSASALASDLICSVVPNLEKDSGSTEPAVEKPPAVKQASVAAITEDASVVKQNESVETKVIENKEKTEAYKVDEIPPTSDSGAMKVATETETISVEKTVVTVTPAGSPSNVASPKSDGHVNKRKNITEYIPFNQLEISGDSIKIKKLKHQPVDVRNVVVFPPDGNIDLVEPDDSDIYLGKKFVDKEEFQLVRIMWYREKRPPYYAEPNGPHMATIVDGGNDAAGLSPSTSGQDKSATVLYSEVKPKGNHPGNITSVAAYKFNSSKLVIENFRNKAFRTTYLNTDKTRNKKFKGYAARITYIYLDNYNADVKT